MVFSHNPAFCGGKAKTLLLNLRAEQCACVQGISADCVEIVMRSQFRKLGQLLLQCHTFAQLLQTWGANPTASDLPPHSVRRTYPVMNHHFGHRIAGLSQWHRCYQDSHTFLRLQTAKWPYFIRALHYQKPWDNQFRPLPGAILIS